MNTLPLGQALAVLYVGLAIGFTLGFVLSALLTMRRKSSRTPE